MDKLFCIFADRQNKYLQQIVISK